MRSGSENVVRFGHKEHSFVYAVALKYMRDPDEADDVTQEALLRAFRHRESFRGDSRFTTWLYQVTATTALMQMRKRQRRGKEQPIGTGEERVAGGRSPEDTAAAREELAVAARELRRLGDGYDRVVRMYVAGYSHSEIAGALGLHAGNVKTRAHRGLSALRAELAAA
jgi:RNA polymerase sigma-70 factor (ECF subfamily)